jgi:hypothetical protein
MGLLLIKPAEVMLFYTGADSRSINTGPLKAMPYD